MLKKYLLPHIFTSINFQFYYFKMFRKMLCILMGIFLTMQNSKATDLLNVPVSKQNPKNAQKISDKKRKKSTTLS